MGYKNISKLLELCENNKAIIVDPWPVLISLCQIYDFYDYIESNMLSPIEVMETKIIKTTDELSKNRKHRAVLLVRRLSRILNYLIVKEDYSVLLSVLSELYSECLRPNIHVYNNRLSRKEWQNAIQFENAIKYEALLYEREITSQEIISLVDIDAHLLTSYLKTCVLDYGYVCIANIEPQIQMPLELFSEKFGIDTRRIYERKDMRQELMRDRYSFKFTDEYILDRISEKSFFSKGSRTTAPIIDILKRHRWIVLLGEPGSGKTNILRYFAHSAASHILNSRKTSHEKPIIPLRVPVFIRLLLFAKACLQSKTWSLLEYICTLGNSSDAGQMLKNEVLKGNSLLLLDGLDEISTFEGRQKVLCCVRDFIEHYILSPNFISPFDDVTACSAYQRFLNGEPPSEISGNQIIITSRFVGYDSAPLLGDRIMHYVVMPLEPSETEKFIDHWFFHVQEAINKETYFNEPDQAITDKIDLRKKCLKEELKGNVYLRGLATNPMLLSMLCIWFYHDKVSQFPILRIEMYKESVEMLLRTWRLAKGATISEDIIIWILVDVAMHMHEKEQSSLIDNFVLVRVCTYSLQAWHEQSYISISDESSVRSKQNFENDAKAFVQMIDQDLGLLVARGEQIYGFIQMTFQEYFVCLRLVDYELDEENVGHVFTNFMSYIRNPRFRLPLILSIEWLSTHWNFANFNQLCEQLVLHENINVPLPLGAILLIESYKDCRQKPNEDILHRALDHFAQIHSKNEWILYYPNLGDQFCSILETLPTAESNRWVLKYLHKASSSEITDLCCLFHRYIDQYYSIAIVPGWLDAHVCQMLSDFCFHDTEEDGYKIERLLQFINTYESRLIQIQHNTLPLARLRATISTLDNYIHPLILASILALSGGLATGTFQIKHLYFEEFNCKHLYRDSALFLPLAEYLEHVDLPHENRMIRLAENCETIICQSISDYKVSLPVIDAFTVLLCIKGMHDQKLYQNYKLHRGFHMAIRRLKKTLFYIRSQYFLPETDKFNDDNETLIYKHARIICETVLEQKIFENRIGVKKVKLDAQELTYRWVNAIAESLASLVVNGDFVQDDEPELSGFPLLRWKLPSKLKNMEENCEIFQQTNLPYITTTTVLTNLICFLSLMIDSNNIVSNQNRQYLDKLLLKSIQNRTHIFFHTYNHPYFLIALLHSHHRALFSCFLNEMNSDMNDCTKKMALIYLVTESLNEFFFKMSNNLFLFLLILVLLVPKLLEYRLKGFLIRYLLRINEETREMLMEILKEHFSAFDCAQTLLDILDESSIEEDIEIERQYLSTIFSEEQSVQDSEIELKLYSTCISLVCLSNTMFSNTDVKSMRSSIIAEVQEAASQMNTLFFKIHILSLCGNYNIQFESLNILSPSAFFLIISRIYPIMAATYDDAWINSTLHRFNDLFNDPHDIIVQQAVCEALLTIECFKKHIFIHIDRCSWKEDIFIWSRVFHFQSPILYLSFTDKLNYSLTHDISNQAVNTLHACLYLTSLCIDAQTLLNEGEGQPIANLFLFDIKKQLKPSDTDDPSLSVVQANTILNYLKTTRMNIDMSRIETIDTALRRFDRVDEDAYSCLRQWLQFHDDLQLKVFAWHAVIYLPIEDDEIQISILMDLFSDQDYFGMKIREARFVIGQNKTNATSPTVIIERFVQIFRSKYPFSDQWFATRLHIGEVEHLLELFQREQQLILEMREQKQSILSLVAFHVFNQELTEALIAEINSLLDNQNFNLLTTRQDRCAYLISLMTHVQNSFLKEVFQSVVKPVQTFVWQTIIEDCKTTPKNQIILFDCIYFYYKQVRYELSEDELKVIKDIAEIYKHNDINKIVNIIDENLTIRLTYMANEYTNTYSMLFEKAQNERMFNLYEISEYIIRHRTKLLPLFINDLFRSFTLAMNDRMVELSYSSIYKEVAEYLCDFNAVEFIIAIKESSSNGESRYKYLLHALKYRKLLSFYGILTDQLMELLFVDDLNMENLENIDEEIIILIKNVSNRSIVEQLNQKLKSKWYMECLLAAKLTVHLAQIGVMSLQETNDEILSAIKYASTNQKMRWFHKHSLECPGHGGLAIELQRILMQLSSIRTGPNANVTDLMDKNCNDISLDFNHALSARNLVVCFYDRDAQDSILRKSYDEIID